MSVNSFSAIAKYYDKIMQKVNYKEWADYIIQLINISPLKRKKTLLDMACGTGTMAIILAERGYNIYGFDKSLEMVKVAKEKIRDKPELNIYLFAGDFMQIPFKDSKFDAVYCIFDSLNNILEEKKLFETFVEVRRILKEGGAFVFDLNTDFSLKKDWGNNTKVEETDDILTIWRTRYENGISTLNFTLFVKEGNAYKRVDATFQERGYDPSTVRKLLKNAGFKAIFAFDHFTLYEGTSKSSRVTYLAY